MPIQLTRRLHLRYLFWLVVPLLLWWVLRHISLSEVWAVLRQLTIPQILALIAANAVVLILLSARWWLISRAQGHPIPYLILSGYRLAAFGVSYFTPGPQFGGEPLQVYLVQRDHNVPPPEAISGVSLDKLLELLSNFTFLTIGVVIILQGRIFPNLAGTQAILLALILLVLSGGFMLAIWFGQHPVSGLWQWSKHLRPSSWVRDNNRLLSVSHSVYHVIRDSENRATHFCRQHPLAVLQALVISGVIWAAMIGEFWLATYVLGLNLTPVQLIMLLTAARIAFLLPVPSGLGTLEASQVLTLDAMGFNPAVGISLSLLIRARDVALGSLGLWWGSKSLRSAD